MAAAAVEGGEAASFDKIDGDSQTASSLLDEAQGGLIDDAEEGTKKKKKEKKHVEKRVSRNLLWGTVSVGLSIGHMLTKMGLRGAHLGTLRGISRLGGGFRRSTTTPEILFFKATIRGVKVRIYRPNCSTDERKKLPVVLYIHGGGWVMCSARSYHSFTQDLCRDLGTIVVSIDYRLAPEFPYPAPLDDCLAVAKAVLNADVHPEEACEELAGRVDVNRVVIGGDSAGGNLSAAVALELIRSGDTRLHAVYLICPALQAITVLFDSHQKFGKHSTVRSGWFLSHYAGVEPSKKILSSIHNGKHVPNDVWENFVAKYVPPSNKEKYASKKKTKKSNSSSSAAAVELTPEEAAGAEVISSVPDAITKLATCKAAWPMLADDSELAQLPTTMIQVCSDDSLLDEGRAFAERLRNCGIADFRYFYVPRAQHCESIFYKTIPTKAARLGYSQIVQFLKDVTAPQCEKVSSSSRQQSSSSPLPSSGADSGIEKKSSSDAIDKTETITTTTKNN